MFVEIQTFTIRRNDAMTFRGKIQQLRKGASEAQSATKIIDKLKALKDRNDSKCIV